MRHLQIVLAILALTFLLSISENEARMQRVPVPPSGQNPFSYVPPNPHSARAMPIPTKNPKRANENILNKGDEWVKQGFPAYTMDRVRVPPSAPNPFSYVPPSPRASKRDAPVTTTKPNVAGEKRLKEGKEWLKKTFTESNTINRARVPPSRSNPFSYVPPNPQASVNYPKPVTTGKSNIAGENDLNKGDEWVKQGFPEYTTKRTRVPPSGPNPFSYVPPNPQASVKSSTTRKAEKDNENVLSKGKEWIKRKFPDSSTINRARVPPLKSNPFSYVPPNPPASVKSSTTKTAEKDTENVLSREKEWIHRRFPDSSTTNRARVPPSGSNPFSYVPPNPRASEQKFPDSSTPNRARVPPPGSNPFSYVPPSPQASVKRASTKPSVHGEISSNEGKKWEKHVVQEHRY